MKRMISLLLVLCLLGSMIPFQAFATEDAPPPETVVEEAPTDETCEEQADVVNADGVYLERIEVEPITVMEYTHGWWVDGYRNENGVWVDEAWFRYYTNPSKIILYYSNGRTNTLDIGEDSDYDLSHTSDQSYYNQWGVGVHTAIVEYEGVSCEYEITITEHNIDYITVEPVSIQQNSYGWWNTEWVLEGEEEVPVKWYQYDIEPEDVTVYYKDGSDATYSVWNLEEYTGFALEYDCTQTYETRWEPGANVVPVTYMGKTYDFVVNIEPVRAVDRIEIPTLYLTEGLDGVYVWGYYWDEELNKYVSGKWFRYEIYPDVVTIYYADGGVEIWETDDLESELAVYSDQDFANPWGVGTHTVTAEFRGEIYEYEIVVQESHIENIVVDPVTLFENIDGYWELDEDWDSELGEWVDVEWFWYSPYPDMLTVYYKDGTSERYQVDDFTEMTGYDLLYDFDQSIDNPWGVGTHTGIAHALGRKFEFEIEVVECPVERIEVAPMTIAQYSGGWWNDGYWDDDYDWVEHRWYWYDINPEEITVYYKDGTVRTYSFWEIEDATGYDVYISDNQDVIGGWDVGTHTATVEFMGVSCDYEVTITEGLVERIEIPTVTLTELMSGWWTESEIMVDEFFYFEEWYYYDIQPMEVTVYYRNGDVVTCAPWELYDQTGYHLNCESDQSWENQWKPGTHTATATFMGVSCEYEVILEPFPEIVRIEVPDVYRTANANLEYMYDMEWDEVLGEWVDIVWTRYNIEPSVFLVYFANGEERAYSIEEAYELFHTDLICESEQSRYVKWEPGTHTATAEFMGVTCEYNVIVEATDVYRIVVHPIILIEGFGGDWEYDEFWNDEWDAFESYYWYRYNIWPSEVTFYYKNGQSATYNTDELYELTGASLQCYTDQGPLNPWGAGIHKATAEYMGVTCEFVVEIIETPVNRIEVAPMVIVEGTHGELEFDEYYDETTEYWYETTWYRYNVRPEEFTVYYNDGRVETYEYWDAEYLTGYELNYSSNQRVENQWGLGTHTATADFMGVSCEYEVTIIETPVERIEVAPQTLIRNCDGYWEEGYWNDDLEEWIEQAWFWYDVTPDEFTVYYKDGTSAVYDVDSAYDETGYDMEFYDEQDGMSPWGLGTHTVRASFMGMEFEYEMTVVENPVERIAVKPVTLLYQTDGVWFDADDMWYDEAWFYYMVIPYEFTIYYKDGTSEDLNIYEAYHQTGYHVEYWDYQECDNQWGMGTYTAYARFMGAECSYEVNIIENPVERIEIADKTIAEGVQYYYHNEEIWDEEAEDWIPVRWSGYDYLPEDITIYYKDGTVATYDYFDLFDATGYGMEFEGVEIYEERWGMGSHTVTFEYMGISGSYDVTIVENPVDRIEVSNVILTEGVDGEWMDEYWDPDLHDYVQGKWFKYDVRPAEVTVYYKDGSVETYAYDDIERLTGNYCDVIYDQTYFNQWGVGTYTATAEYMGRYCDYQVIIQPNGDVSSLAVTRQPVDYIGAMNSMAAFTVEVNRDDVTYQWYYSIDGKTWAKSGASGATTAALSVQVIASRLGQMYRCVITDSRGNQVTSNVVSLNLPESTIVIHAQPENFVGAVADTATFTVEATGEGLTYRWYYSTDGKGWAESWTSGYNTPTASPVLREYNSGRMFKCLITDKNGNTEWTEVVSMSLDTGDIIITSQPVDYLGRLNDLAEYTVEAEGVNLTYRWYFSNDGGETWGESWSTGYNSPTLKVRLHAYRDGYIYKCVIRSGVNNEVESEPVMLNKLPTTVKITAQPINAGGPIGSSVTFTMGATGEGLTYQWQYSSNGGETWTNSGMTGAKTNSLTVMVNAGRDGQMYRCVVTDDSGSSVATNAVVLRVGNAPVIVSQPQSYTGAAGTTAVFAVEATGDDLTYQWQYSSNGGETWINSSTTGAKTASISIGALAYRNGQMYRCVITNEYGSVISDAATLTVQ